MLHEVAFELPASRTRSNFFKPWCGPTAIASILGCTYRAATWKIMEVRDGPFDSTSNLAELIKVLTDEGRKVEHVRLPLKPTLRDFLITQASQWAGKRLLIRITNHFLAYADGHLCDSWMTERKVLPIASVTKGMNKLVTDVLVVE